MASIPSLKYETAVKLLDEHHDVELNHYVETGARHGHSLRQFQNHAWTCYGVEMHRRVYKALVKQVGFEGMYMGDSAQVLPELLAALEAPCLFFLDAHYWGGYRGHGSYSDNPLLSELCAIRNHQYPDFVIIDDAQLFGASPKRIKTSTIDPGWLGITEASVLTALGRSRIRSTGFVKGNIHTHFWASLRE